MSLFRSKIVRIVAPVFLLAIMAGTAYAFNATNTVNQSAAGDGKATIGGYTVGAITYAIDASSPQNLDSVSFSLTPSIAGAPVATTVRVSLVGGTDWLAFGNCIIAGGTWTCTTAGTTVVAATSLEVVATGASS